MAGSMRQSGVDGTGLRCCETGRSPLRGSQVTDIDFKAFLGDIGLELLDITRNESLYTPNSEFNAGYRAAIYSVIYMLQSEIQAWGGSTGDIGLAGFSPDEWRIQGKDYWGARDKAS